MLEFEKWPSIPRLKRGMVVTEKIDGTNACINIDPEDGSVTVQSRKRLITPDDDNFGFASWVRDNAGALTDVLGPGRHYGEWWGPGIQRGYDIPKRRFSLFNVARWRDSETNLVHEDIHRVDNLDVVPVLYRGDFSIDTIDAVNDQLRKFGSWASEGFMRPEGVVVFHVQSRQLFKVLIENDEISKTEAAARGTL